MKINSRNIMSGAVALSVIAAAGIGTSEAGSRSRSSEGLGATAGAALLAPPAAPRQAQSPQSQICLGISGAGQATQVAFFDAAGCAGPTQSITSEANLFWDPVNDRLGIGTSVPSRNLTVVGIGRIDAANAGSTWIATNTLGTGLNGAASNPSGAGFGTVGQHSSPAGTGVFGSTIGGIATGAGDAIAVWGQTGSGIGGGAGVFGGNFAPDTSADPNSFAPGVWGQTATSSGNVNGNVSGTAAGYFGGTGLDSTGVVGYGNGAVIPAIWVEEDGVGGAFTGESFGVLAGTTTCNLDPNQFINAAVETVNGDAVCGLNVVYVNAWDGLGYFKIIGGGVVSTVVSDVRNNPVVMFAPEGPEPMFTDYGSGQLVNGFAHIDLDPILAKNISVTVNNPLRVFVQVEGNPSVTGVVVTNKTATGFDVMQAGGGTANAAFSYQVTAKRAAEQFGTRTARYDEMRFPSFSNRVTEGKIQKATPKVSAQRLVE